MARATKHVPNVNQIPLFIPESKWTPPDLATLPDWNTTKRVSIDAETRDEHLHDLGPGVRRGGYTVGWSISLEGGPSFYLPIRHEGGGNLPVDSVLKYLRAQAATFKGEVVGANLGYDLDYAYADGIEFKSLEYFRDVCIADPLIYELHNSYSLDSIGTRNGIASKDERLLKEAVAAFGGDPTKKDYKKHIWRLPAHLVGPYAERDTTSPLEIYARQRKEIEKDNLWQVMNLESAVLPVLVKMRRRGVRIDFDKLDQIHDWARDQEIESLAKIKDITGYDIGLGNIWKAEAIAPAFERIGVALERTSTGAPQIDGALFDSLDHPVAKAVRWARKTNKMRTTFDASIRKYAVNGRIHCTFNQIARETEKGEQKGARYGRLSCIDPNLQQQYNPEKEPQLAGEWRKIFIPEEGAIFGSNDYSQQEPRWTTHFAALKGLDKAEEAAKRYRDDPKTDNHTMMTKLIHGEDVVANMSKAEFKTARTYAKCIFLGLCYGEGGAKLCHDIGKPTAFLLVLGHGRNKEYKKFTTKHEAWSEKAGDSREGYIIEVAGEEGQNIINSFDKNVPFVKKLANQASEFAKKNGYIKTVMNRRLHFPLKHDGSYDWAHKALNRVIQGSSGDQTKLALVECDRAGHFIQLQVHDEINGSYASVEEAKQVGRIMSDCIKTVCNPRVPFNVDTECGPSWGEAKGV